MREVKRLKFFLLTVGMEMLLSGMECQRDRMAAWAPLGLAVHKLHHFLIFIRLINSHIEHSQTLKSCRESERKCRKFLITFAQLPMLYASQSGEGVGVFP